MQIIGGGLKENIRRASGNLLYIEEGIPKAACRKDRPLFLFVFGGILR